MIVLFDPQQDASRVYYGTDTRAFALTFRCITCRGFCGIIGWFQEDFQPVSIWFWGSVSFVVLLVMTIAINGSSNFWYRGGQFVGTILTRRVVIYTVLGRKTWLSRFLSNPVFKWIWWIVHTAYICGIIQSFC